MMPADYTSASSGVAPQAYRIPNGRLYYIYSVSCVYLHTICQRSGTDLVSVVRVGHNHHNLLGSGQPHVPESNEKQLIALKTIEADCMILHARPLSCEVVCGVLGIYRVANLPRNCQICCGTQNTKRIMSPTHQIHTHHPQYSTIGT